jgi:hypothetical protein
VGGIGARDRVEDQPAVIGGQRERPELVERPAERHRAVTTHGAVRRTQAGDAAERARREDRSRGFAADCEGDESSGDRGAGTARRSAGPELEIPRRAARTGERRVGVVVAEAARKLDHRQFRDEHRAGVREPLDDRRVVVEDLIAIGLGAPRRRDAFRREEILHAIRNAEERAILHAASGELCVGGGSFAERALARNRDDRAELRAIFFEPREIEIRQLHRGDLARLQRA